MPVADESTEAFMSSFYALRVKSPGVSKVQCLRQIQVARMQVQLAPGTGNKATSRAGATRSTAKSRNAEFAAELVTSVLMGSVYSAGQLDVRRVIGLTIGLSGRLDFVCRLH